MKNRPEYVAYALVALVAILVTVLTALHVVVPEVLPYIAVGALGVGGGVALPRGTDATSSATNPDAVADRPRAIPAPAPAPLVESASPVATHAP